MSHHNVIILGSGPAGLTAAVYMARANLSPLLIHGPLPGGQLTTTTEVENFPGFADGIMGPDLMIAMESQAKRFGTTIITDTVKEAILTEGVKTLKTGKETYTADALVIATGASPKRLNVAREEELTGYGVSTCATCDGAFFRGKPVAVVGGGDSACEEANFLTRFASEVFLIHRRSELRASKIMADRVLSNKKIKPIWNSAISELHGSREKGVSGVTLKDLPSGKESPLTVEAVFIAIGHIPNTTLFSGQINLDPQGYILPEPGTTKTNIPGVFACGDVQDHSYRQAITAAGSGCMAAIDCERWLEGRHH